MAVYFTTSDPKKLLAAFKKAIDDKKVVTWSYDKDGDFTHDADQWRHKAWFRPSIQSGSLRFSILKPQNAAITAVVYGIYHGRLIEPFVTHFDDMFMEGVATAKAQSDDKVS